MTARSRGWVRGAVCLTCVIVLCLGAAPWSVWVPAASPLTSLACSLSTRTLSWTAVPGLLLLALSAWRHRWFCHWCCPTGWCADGATWVGRRLGRRARPWPCVGRWLAAMMLGGACLGYPLLSWTDPIAVLSGATSLAARRGSAMLSLGLLGLAVILVLSVVFPQAWCGHCCPLGGLQDLVAPGVRRRMRRRLHVDPASPGAQSSAPGPRFPRRVVLAALAGLAWASGLRHASRRPARVLRPPGAVNASRFTTLCIRCGNCLRACPPGIITLDLGTAGAGGFLAPMISFDTDYCHETCQRCTLVCPSGALVPVKPDRKPQAVIGVPHVDMNVCLLGDDRECALCRNHCPYEAIRLVFDDERYTLTPRIDLNRCPGCGACQVACPTQPHKAITVQPVRA